jgi:hypothetical protein
VNKKSGYTKLPHGFHARLKELKGIRLFVWLAHRIREGKQGTSYPSLSLLASDTGYSEDRVCRARSWLRDHGWLKTVGYRDAGTGEFKVPIEATNIPPLCETYNGIPCTESTADASANCTSTVVQKAGTAKCTTEEDTLIGEVTPTQEATSKQLGGLNDLNEAVKSSNPPEPESFSYKRVEEILDRNYEDVPATQDEIAGIANLVSSWDETRFEFLEKFIRSKKWSNALQTPSDILFRLSKKGEPQTLNDNRGALPVEIEKAVAGRARFESKQLQGSGNFTLTEEDGDEECSPTSAGGKCGFEIEEF